MAAHLGRVAGLDIEGEPSAAIGSGVLCGVLAAGAARLLGWPLRTALAGGLAAVLGHWASAFWHQFGHAIAARQTGYPMSGIRLYQLLDASVYPADEPELAANIHRRRALGGPVASALLACASGGVAFALRRRPGLARALARFVFLDNLLITLGALSPLGFTDGSTLLRLRGQD